MKKLKKFYKEHRVFTILMAIAIVCLILMTTVLIQCFYVGGDNGKYGDRLEGIEDVKLTKSKINDVESTFTQNDKVKKAEINVTGKIVYFNITFSSEESLVEAQSICLKSLDKFSEKEKSFYDFHFTLKQESTDKSDGFLISGSKNKNGSALVWNNNNTTAEGTKEGN